MKSIVHTAAMLLCLMGSAFSGIAHASMISVSPIYMTFELGEPMYQDLQVFNLKAGKAYVAAHLVKVDHFGQADKKEIAFNDNPNQFGMVIAPPKMILLGHGQSSIRVVLLKRPVKHDLMYKIYIKPAEGELVPIATDDKRVEGGVELIIQDAVLTYVRVADPRPKITLKQKQKLLIIQNTGNTKLKLIHIKQCPPTGHYEKCIKYANHLLFYGDAVTLKLKQDWPVQITQSCLGKLQHYRSSSPVPQE